MTTPIEPIDGSRPPEPPELPLLGEAIQIAIERVVCERGGREGGCFYAIDLAQIGRNLDLFAQYFGAASVHYAVKANAAPVVLSYFAGRGAGFEVASAGELARVLELGVAGRRVVYGNPCRDERDIARCRAAGVRSLSFETLEELQRLCLLAPEVEAMLRLDVGSDGGDFIDFGATLEDVRAMVVADPVACRAISGLTFYGCHATGIQHCAQILEHLLPGVRFVDLGGGFLSPPFVRELRGGQRAGALDWLLDAVGDLRRRFAVEVLVEPGAALVKNAIHAVAFVKYVRRGARFDTAHLDLGPTQGLPRAPEAVYLASRPKPAVGSHATLLVDATCARNWIGTLEGARPLEVGEPVIFPEVGSYSFVYATDFHALPRADAVVLPEVDPGLVGQGPPFVRRRLDDLGVDDQRGVGSRAPPTTTRKPT